MRYLLLLGSLFIMLLFTACTNTQDSDNNLYDPFSGVDGIAQVRLATVASGVAINSSMSMLFSTPMDGSTINTTNIIVKNLATGTIHPITNLVTDNNTSVNYVTLFFNTFLPSTTYRLTLTTNVVYYLGTNLDKNYTYDFTTGTTQDVTVPILTTTHDANQSFNMYSAYKITINKI